ncbi:EsV-1-1 [Ectocarpus siliculosus]|uniref:EsV-1-1 n=1 Tax=Ectocarpus siliculosus TaxID=2880 RepID=D7G449_ECTSI|nr:EsV-1-1 [Ectocarpus siliculosus]|eukprot:CBJ33667.1 EsV-1-1 [Ectocarpus siliculosus]
MPSTLSKLYDAAASGSVERTVAVLSQGSVNIDGGYGDVGRTPLMAASTMGYLRVVRVLLRLGARVSVADNDGATALHLSIVNKHLAVSKALVKAGAGVEARGVDGTPLHVAAAKGFHKGMVMLIHAGGCSSRDLLVLAERLGEINADRSHAAGSEAQGDEASGGCGLGGPVQVQQQGGRTVPGVLSG